MIRTLLDNQIILLLLVINILAMVFVLIIAIINLIILSFIFTIEGMNILINFLNHIFILTLLNKLINKIDVKLVSILHLCQHFLFVLFLLYVYQLLD